MYKMKTLPLHTMKPQFLIAAPSSNCGKTTITLGLIRLLKNRGCKVQPFKCGPDYIDPKYHTLAADKPGINLDTFMMEPADVKRIYASYAYDADVAIVEGVMGLFDGADKMHGSSAEMALLLNLPVVLIVNAAAMAYSVAPLLYGFRHFNPAVKIAGVIFNFVNTESHYRFLKDASDDVGIPALGYIPANEDIRIPSRHLGLVTPQQDKYETGITQIAQHLEKTVDVNRLLEICTTDLMYPPAPENKAGALPKPELTIAIAQDDAFNFIYHENIQRLKELGTVIYFSPLKDSNLPDADLLYLAGGYPELHLQELTANTRMRKAILDFCKRGGKVLAECGGMMYLGKTITGKEGEKHAMVGFLDLETTIAHPKLILGYRNVLINNVSIKGHEFHYSTCIEKTALPAIGEVFNARGVKVNTPVYKQLNVVASYIHFYWGAAPIFNAFGWHALS